MTYFSKLSFMIIDSSTYLHMPNLISDIVHAVLFINENTCSIAVFESNKIKENDHIDCIISSLKCSKTDNYKNF